MTILKANHEQPLSPAEAEAVRKALSRAEYPLGDLKGVAEVIEMLMNRIEEDDRGAINLGFKVSPLPYEAMAWITGRLNVAVQELDVAVNGHWPGPEAETQPVTTTLTAAEAAFAALKVATERFNGLPKDASDEEFQQHEDAYNAAFATVVEIPITSAPAAAAMLGFLIESEACLAPDAGPWRGMATRVQEFLGTVRSQDASTAARATFRLPIDIAPRPADPILAMLTEHRRTADLANKLVLGDGGHSEAVRQQIDTLMQTMDLSMDRICETPVTSLAGAIAKLEELIRCGDLDPPGSTTDRLFRDALRFLKEKDIHEDEGRPLDTSTASPAVPASVLALGTALQGQQASRTLHQEGKEPEAG